MLMGADFLFDFECSGSIIADEEGAALIALADLAGSLPATETGFGSRCFDCSVVAARFRSGEDNDLIRPSFGSQARGPMVG